MSIINSERDEDNFVKLSPQTPLEGNSTSDGFISMADTESPNT